MKKSEGHIPFKGFETYYKIVGAKTSKPPLLVLHGGPGGAHNYLLDLAALANDRQVIFYDQLGGGVSDRPKDDTLWTIPLFVEELKTVREHLGLKKFHLYGHSWGGMLSIEYMLTKPKGVVSVVLASAMISMPLYQKEVDKLKRALPKEVSKTLFKHEREGTLGSVEYANAVVEYYARHIYQGKEWPPELLSANPAFGDSYRVMWGANEAFANGSMKKWDKIDELKEIKVPTLITAGQYDELTPEQALLTQSQIANSEIKIFTAGSHCVHAEQSEEYVKVIREFLRKND